MSDAIALRPRRPVPVSLAMLLIIGVGLTATFEACHDLGVINRDMPEDDSGFGNLIVMVLIFSMLVANILPLLVLTLLIWFRQGWARIVFASFCLLLWLPSLILLYSPNGIGLGFKPMGEVLAAGLLGATILMFLPRANRWFKRA